ncbi:MAG: penicillin-binding protein activator [Bdellovibrionales bacterium]|nr:penicillin-binding protein activator [Bdellovibrionales bacterium]
MTKKNLMLVWALGLIAAIISGCSSVVTRKVNVQPASTKAREEWNQLQVLVASGNERHTLSRLKKFVGTYPGTDLAYDAQMTLGKIYYKNKDYLSAYNSFRELFNARSLNASESDPLLWGAKSLYRLGRLDESLILTTKILQSSGLSDPMRLECYKVRYTILNDLSDRLEALRTLVYLGEKDPETKSRESYRVRAFDFVESKLSDKELETVAGQDEFSFVRKMALYKLGVHLFEQRDFVRAREVLSQLTESDLNADLSQQVKNYLTQIDSRREVDSKTIGVVLPLTGKYSVIAQKTLRGLQLGLGIYGPRPSDLKLAVADSEGTPDGARRAVERLVTEDHVIGIVGSLLSKTAAVVATKADELGVPSIGLSQKAGLTEVGETVFRNSLTSEDQVRHIVKVAMEEMGMKSFAILFPNDSYGVEYTNLFWNEVVSRGGVITAAQPYNPNENDYSGPIQRLVGKYYVEDRVREYKTRLTEWYKQQKKLNARHKPPDDLLPPIVNFEGIFIPDGLKALNQIAPTLAFYDVKNVKLLGTSLWNSEELAQRCDRHVDGAIFMDSFLNEDSKFTTSVFYKEFQTSFGEMPGPFEVQSYDTGLILRQILVSGTKTRTDLLEKLRQVKDFPGALNKLNLSNEREFSRPRVTLTINKGKILRYEDAKSTNL